MQTWIALFRGINVGGNNILRMADLRTLLESLGLKNVRSYIQSGNVVFESSDSIASVLTGRIGHRINVGVVTTARNYRTVDTIRSMLTHT